MHAVRAVPVSAIAAWVVYDLANTMFSMNVVSRHFPPYITRDLGHADIWVSLAFGLSQLVVALTAPGLGARAEHAGKKPASLRLATLACVTATACIGIGGFPVAMIAFFAANIAYQLALVFYDGMLANVAPTEQRRGLIGGIGIGVGYVGSILGLLAMDPVQQHYGRPWVFFGTAALFLTFAWPSFIWLGGASKNDGNPDGRGQPLRLADLRKNPRLLRFLVARFLYADGVNTVILFMALFLQSELGMAEKNVTNFLVFSTVFALIGGFAFGWLTDRAGPRRTLLFVIGGWTCMFGLFATIRDPSAIMVMGPVTGLLLGGLWAADRPMLAALVPPEQNGAAFGWYNTVGRFAALGGPLLWSAAAWIGREFFAMATGYGLSIAALGVVMAVSWTMLRGLDRVPPHPAP